MDRGFCTRIKKERMHLFPQAVYVGHDYLPWYFLYMSVNIISTTCINVLEENYILFTEEAPPETWSCREMDRPRAREANWGRLLFYWPVSSSSPFIHLMEAAGLLPMAVQVSSVSFPSLTTSSWLSMIGVPGGTERHQHGNILHLHTHLSNGPHARNTCVNKLFLKWYMQHTFL